VKSKLIIANALFFLGSCTTPVPTRTIEPKATEDQAFTISRAPTGAQVNLAAYPIHLAEKWYPFRATFLSVTPEDALTRDGKISDVSAPSQFWDEQTAVEAVSIWSALCNECHGGRRKLKDATSMPKPVVGWGKGQGLFFGKRRPYAEIFGVISGGGPERNGKQSEMPSWRQKLSREQIWSVIYFLEFQSGGIEGTFPPSLYPRGAQDSE
jgi:mono/diheme cytochrome c family protein